jgi:hypothetical protein
MKNIYPLRYKKKKSKRKKKDISLLSPFLLDGGAIQVLYSFGYFVLPPFLVSF